eukprot:1161235-Pelagomonas_calceolata.AAC.6
MDDPFASIASMAHPHMSDPGNLSFGRHHPANEETAFKPFNIDVTPLQKFLIALARQVLVIGPMLLAWSAQILFCESVDSNMCARACFQVVLLSHTLQCASQASDVNSQSEPPL